MTDDSCEVNLAGPKIRGVKGGRQEDLRCVARYQKGVIYCVVVQLLSVICQFVIPAEMRLIIAGGAVLTGLVGTVFVFLLSTKLYSIAAGVMLGLLTLIPIIGFIVLLVLNNNATYVLQLNDVKVGLLGADLSKL